MSVRCSFVIVHKKFRCASALTLFTGTWHLQFSSLLIVCLKHALQYFLKTGTCKYGSTCKYHHPRDRRGAAPVSFNVLGLPMRQVFTSWHLRLNNFQIDYYFCIGRNIYKSFYCFNIFYIAFRKRNHVPITCELGCVNLELLASFIIHSLPPLEMPLQLDLLPQQLFLRLVYHMSMGFLHGLYQECHIYLGRVFNLMCLLFYLLRKALCPHQTGTTTWFVVYAKSLVLVYALAVPVTHYMPQSCIFFHMLIIMLLEL